MPKADTSVDRAVSTGDMRDHETGQWRAMRPVRDLERCTSCMLCWLYCPEGCVYATEKPDRDLTYCKGCGICAVECPVHAITMEPERT
jgi:pyruvate ferredoxin oxidoreductase delta subunit